MKRSNNSVVDFFDKSYSFTNSPSELVMNNIIPKSQKDEELDLDLDLNLGVGTYTWNQYSCSDAFRCGWAPSNFTFTIANYIENTQI